MDLQKVINTVFGTLIRHGASTLGGFLVAKGYVDADTAASLTEYLVGGGLIVVAAIASYFFKQKALKTPA